MAVFGVANVSSRIERRVLEARLDVAVGPLVGRLAHGQLALGHSAKVLRRPLHFLHCRSRWLTRSRPEGPVPTRCPRQWRLARPGRRRFEGSTYDGNGSHSMVIFSMAFGCDDSLIGSNGQHRVAVIHRLVGERPFAADVGLDDPESVSRAAAPGTSSAVTMALTPGTASASVSPGAGCVRAASGLKQLREQHPLGAVVFSEFRRACDLGSQIRSRVVLSDERVLGGHRHASARKSGRA